MMKSNAEARTLSVHIENMLLERNLRGMKTMQSALTPGYVLRAAKLLLPLRGCVLIGTGFPVAGTFETDGPVGAIALYEALAAQGAEPIIVCGLPLSAELAKDYRVHPLKVGPHPARGQEARDALQRLRPELIISIERPGLASDGHYYNMRGENISAGAACFDTFLQYASCPSVAIGDGGNEIGMGNIQQALSTLDIQASVTECSELVIADVSNWAALGLIAMLDWLSGRDMLAQLDSLAVLAYLSARGSVDGVSRENTLSEDGLPAVAGVDLLHRLRLLVKAH
ncbi:MAG: DUF4392 domain-containing protein [Bermanella sp.]